MDENNIQDSAPDCKALSIFVTQDDKISTDFRGMSDFVSRGLTTIVRDLSTTEQCRTIDVQPGDIAVIQQALRYGKALMHGKHDYELDYDSLPKEVLEKFKKGIYKLGESRQVEGNLRAVVVDEAGQRVKDITLKEVVHTPDSAPLLQNMAFQKQLRQINEKLDYIIEMQDYHIDLDRNAQIIKPFFNARDSVVRAQNEHDQAHRIDLLNKAVDQLCDGRNAIQLDMAALSKRFMLLTKPPVFRPTRSINKYIGFMTEDLQLLVRYNSVLIQVYNYLGKSIDAANEYARYRSFMLDFYTKAIGSRQLALSLQIHNAISYSKENMDSWKEMTDEMIPVLQSREQQNDTIIITLED